MHANQHYNEIMKYVYRAKDDLISVIVNEIAKYESDWEKSGNLWFCNFFQTLKRQHH
jgi:hypothetical protein